MTRRQLAGLRFHAQPDYYTWIAGPTTVEARERTKRIVGLARQTLGDDRLWERFMSWTPPPRIDLAQVASAVFGNASSPRLDHEQLTRHWLTQLVYRRQPATGAELAGGLIRWELTALLERIRRSVDSGGIALHGK
jgi:hypothetical protein